MLRLQPKPKDRRKVRIPDELREALGEVLHIIKEARRDPQVSLDFDDAIQVDPLCGGRYQKKPSRYHLRYWCGDPANGRAWDLELGDLEIEDIASGWATELTLYCCVSPGCGHRSNKAGRYCDCDYERDRSFGTFPFPEAHEVVRRLGITGISESSTREDVFAALGPAGEVGGGETSQYGYIWPWVKYRRADCQIRFEFGKNGQIRSISVMDKDWKAGQ